MITIESWGKVDEEFLSLFQSCKKPQSKLTKIIEFTSPNINLEHAIYKNRKGEIFMYEEASDERDGVNNGWYVTWLPVEEVLIELSYQRQNTKSQRSTKAIPNQLVFNL